MTPGVVEALQRLRDLIIPDECAACLARPPLAEPLCITCGAVLAESVPATRPGVLPTAVTIAAGGYRGVLRASVLAYKDGGRRDLADSLARLLATVVEPACDRPTVLLPIPSTRRSRCRRGFDHMRLLADRLARRLPRTGWLPALRAGPRPDSLGLSVADRRRAAAESLSGVAGPVKRLRELRRRVPALRVLLIDDIVTSGATLSAAYSVLRRAGVSVAGAMTVASAESNPRLMVTSGF